MDWIWFYDRLSGKRDSSVVSFSITFEPFTNMLSAGLLGATWKISLAHCTTWRFPRPRWPVTARSHGVAPSALPWDKAGRLAKTNPQRSASPSVGSQRSFPWWVKVTPRLLSQEQCGSWFSTGSSRKLWLWCSSSLSCCSCPAHQWRVTIGYQTPEEPPLKGEFGPVIHLMTLTRHTAGP